MAKEEQKIGYKDILHQKEYMKMILAALINRFGDAIDAIAFTWLVYEITGSAAWSAIMYGVNKVPTMLVTPLAGVCVEGRNKKMIMIITDVIRAICVAIIATGYMLHVLQPWMLLVITFIISTAEAFRGPANTALTPRVLKREYYEYGMSLMSTMTSITELVGTAVAAGVIAILGCSGAIYIDMITFILSAVIILTVNTKEPKAQKQKFQAETFMGDFVAGIQYIKKQRIICFLLGIIVFLNGILVPINSLQAAMSNEILHSGAEILSIFSIAITLGMLLGSFCFPMVKKKLSGKSVMTLGGIAISFFYIGLPIFESLYGNKIFVYLWCAFLSTFLGFAVALVNSYISVLSIACVEEEYLARMGGIATSISVISMPILSFLIGILVAKVSTSVMFYLSGVLAFMVAIYCFQSKVIDEDEEIMESKELV